MSDIGIRFDGLILLLALAASTVIYGLIAAIAAVAALRRGYRPRVARRAAVLAIGTTAIGAAFFAWWAQQGTAHQGVNWLDWLTVPWLLLFAIGLWTLKPR